MQHELPWFLHSKCEQDVFQLVLIEHGASIVERKLRKVVGLSTETTCNNNNNIRGSGINLTCIE